MTSPIGPYVYSGLLAAKTMGMKGMNTTYQISQKDIDTLKVPFAQASLLLMTSNDNLHFPEYNSFKSTILSLADKIYGKDSIGSLLKTILDSMTVNTDGNLVLSTTNSNQIEKVNKLAFDYEYQFETTYGAALFDTLGIDIPSQGNYSKNGVKSKKIPTKKSNLRPNGMLNSAAAAAGGAQVGGARLAKINDDQEPRVLGLIIYLIKRQYRGSPGLRDTLIDEATELVNNAFIYDHKYEELLPILAAVIDYLHINYAMEFPHVSPERMAPVDGMIHELSRYESHIQEAAQAAHRGQNHGAAQAAHRGQNNGAAQAVRHRQVPGTAMVAHQQIPGTAQPQRDLYEIYQQLGDRILRRQDIEEFDHMFMLNIERALLRQSARPDFEPERVAGFLLNIADLRAQQGIMNPSRGSRDAEAYLEFVNKRMTDSIPDWTEIIVGAGVTGLAVGVGTGIVAFEAGLAKFLMPPAILSGTSGLSGWAAFVQIIDNIGYHTIFSIISRLTGGTGGQQALVGLTRIGIAVLFAILVVVSILFHKYLMNLIRKTPEQGAAEFEKVIQNLQNAITYGIAQTAKTSAVAARDVALIALGIAGQVAPIVAEAAGKGASALVARGYNAAKSLKDFTENSGSALGSALGSAARSSKNVGQRAASSLASTASTLGSKALSFISTGNQKTDERMTALAALERALIYAPSQPQRQLAFDSADAAPLVASSSMPRQSQASIRMIPQQMSQQLHRQLFGQEAAREAVSYQDQEAVAVNASRHRLNRAPSAAPRGVSAFNFTFLQPPQSSNPLAFSQVQSVAVDNPPPVLAPHAHQWAQAAASAANSNRSHSASQFTGSSSAAAANVPRVPPVLVSDLMNGSASASARSPTMPHLEKPVKRERGGRRKYSGRKTKHKKRHNKRHTKRRTRK